MPGACVPENFRVPIASIHLIQYRIAAELGKGSTVKTPCQILGHSFSMPGVKKYERRFFSRAEPAGILPIDYRTSTEHHPVLLGRQVGVKRDRQLLPLHEIFADGVSPVHISPPPTVRIMLVEKMVFPVVEAQPVRVVQPPTSGRKMELRPEFFSVKVFLAPDLIGVTDQV